MLVALSIACCACASIPAVLTVLNLREYAAPPELAALPATDDLERVAVCIPARNEADGIAACVESVLRSRIARLQVIVVDDHSTDGTAAAVQALAEADTRVRLVEAPSLPAGWNGKQHACWVAAQLAAPPKDASPSAAPGGFVEPGTDRTRTLLCFLDADVRLQPDALHRMAAMLHGTGAALASGFPLEETGTPLEWLLLPLIHFVLLGYLPLALLRRTRLPGFAAGCGQFLLVDSSAYFAAGGHAAIRQTMHDGLRLPRLLRSHGYSTRLADLTTLARCRMYRSAASTWRGLAKNATEGLAAPGSIVPFTLLLGLGQVLPIPLLLVALAKESGVEPEALLCAWAAVVLSYLPRLLLLRRFQQRPVSAVLHPVGVATLLALQWYALARKLLGRPASWKERAYAAN